ncbi:E3 SUMO-protein ligase ZBED1-like [Entelurus aequoreus]|uniref:E3 SUMO-protein ligase ZBED1-like n=1 Tax=Entelurus aequoreus TaxID=161455 RepID=UPI002B1CF598|nr:E3 SUMO-protein ligase ZBED1-like [Entelurus aequoreus]
MAAAAGSEVEEDLVLIQKKSSTSVIWDYFGFETSDVHQKQVLCKTCRAKVATSQGNTTNLFRHLKNHHRQLHDECMTKKSGEKSTPSDSAHCSKHTTITASFASITPYEKSSRRHKEITTAITHYIGKDMVSVNTVTKEGFQNLLHTLDRRYKIPSRTYFNQVAIPQLYAECKEKVEREVKNVLYYATTTDMWSSRTSEPYLSLTLHYINDDFELKSRCLQTAYFPMDHTGENIALGLRECLASWGLKEEDQTCITTDNGANVVKAVQLNQWTRLQCFGHRLHLAIENAVKDDVRVKRATGLCKQLVGHFSHSWKKKAALKKAQQELKIPEHSLITECPTRWGSRQRMIGRVLEQSKALSQVLSEDKKTRHLVPTWQDTDVLESLNNALGPLQEFTDALSGEAYVSVSYLKPVLHLLRTSILTVDKDDPDLPRDIKSRALRYIEDKYSDPATQELLDIASFLDPRFKTDYIRAENVPDIKERVRIEMEQVARKEKRARVSTTEAMPQGAAEAEPSTVGKGKRSLGSFFKSRPSVPPPSTTMQLEDAINAELNSYLITPTIDGEDNPLAWWRVHNVNFPWLSKLARKFLCIPATSSPSERLFSASGNVVTCQRSCLKPSKVDMLVFLTKNL